MYEESKYPRDYIELRIDYGAEPMELRELAKCFDALASYYKRYAQQERKRRRERGSAFSEEAVYRREDISSGEGILLVESISEGSLKCLLSDKGIYFSIDRTTLLVAFGLFLSHNIDIAESGGRFEGSGQKQDRLSCENMSTIVGCISARDNAALGISVVQAEELIINNTYSSKSAQVIQKNINEQINEMKTERLAVLAAQSFYWHQVRSAKSRRGDQGVIKDIHDKPLPVLFDNQADKDWMLGHSIFTHDYVVDVQVSYRYGKPVEYKILAVYNSIPKLQ